MKVHKLNEVRLNTHQTHLESLVTLGKDGLNELNSHIQKFLNMLEGNNELTLMSKIDGAPSVFMWHKLAGYPDDSIALKSFTSGPNTALSSDEQVDQRYGDRPDMAEKLKQCLKLAKYIPDGQAWQGDCLFTKNDLKEEEINGTGYITFHPNKIVYAFSEDNPGYNDVKNADLGIAFHTIYTIDKDGNKVQSFEVDNSDIKAPKNFYLLFHEMDTKDRKKDFNVDKFNKEFNELKSLEQKLINDPNYEDLVTNKSFIDYWNTFENTELADKKQVNINAGTVIKDLTDYIKDKKEKEYDKKLSTLKSDQGREKAKEKYDRDLLELEDLINNNKDTIVNLVNTLNKAADIKMIMWNGLNKTKDNFSTFYKSRTKGFVPANREGISMSDKDGNLVKIVDRSEFSSNNRNPDYLAGFEHESLDLHEDIDIDKLDIKLKPALEKFLGDKKKEFIETIVKMILDHTAYDYSNLGVYRDDMYPEDHLDANGKPVQAKLRKVHNFWLDKFGLDTSKRGVGSAIDSAITSIDWAIDDTDEYKDTLDWDDTKKLPEDEQFKIRLFYDWDVDVRKNFWGEYDDDDPITQMSFKEYLEYLLKEGNYSGHERDLIKDMIEEIKDGHGYFEERDVDEEMATQRSDMGSFNKPIFNKKKLTLKEDPDKTAVVAVGRMNPPTIGHAALVKALANIGSKYGVKAKLFLTHTSNNQKNPLSYESKLRWANKAFGDSVEVVKTDARSILDYLSELYNEGYNKLVYVGGGGRIGGDEDVTGTILKYNGQPDKTGKLLYNFDDIKFEDSGSREVPYEGAEQSSATHVRKLVIEDNFDEFKKYVPFNERDAYRLFKELKYAMKGKEESFLESCEKRIKSLREASTTLNTPLGNVLKKYIGNDVEYKSLNQGRHPKETLRINSQKSKEELINDLKRKLSSVPNDPITLNGVEYHISKINFNDIGPHDGASHEYDSIPVEVESDNDKQVFYISLATKDDKFASSKLYTPNKVLGNGIGYFVKNSSLEFNEGYEFLEKIYKEAIGNAKGDLKGFESHVSSVEGVNETNINSVMKDFGEVLSAGCLAHVLGSPEEVYFPAASNEPLVDFIVNGTIKVSQKAGSGAAPSGDSIFCLISDSKLNANQILVDYSKNDIKRIMAMISFFRNYVFDSSVSIHNGYVNMAEAVISGKINFVDLPNLSSVQKYFKPNSVTGKNMERFIDSMKPLIGSNIKYDPRKISNQDYCETIRNRYIARILIVSVNRDEVLIKGMNTLLSACLGEFVQVYLINPTEFLKGHFIFKVKQIDSSHEYVLSDASAIDAKNRIGTKKLSMKLK